MTQDILSDSSLMEASAFPKISVVSEEVERPFWSVMIPVYNRTTYLQKTLTSVLQQDPGSKLMQIEVIDNCSDKMDVESLVKEVAGDRVSYYRQPQNVEIAINWNTCVERAKGQWVHILHDDDLVLTGFYEHFHRKLQENPSVGAAFCRCALIDEEGHWQSLINLERRASGVLDDWIRRIGTQSLMHAPAIVVKRSSYERLGGFTPKLSYAVDWEMWTRISCFFPIWYEPEILALYRVHSESGTSEALLKNKLRNKDIKDVHELTKLSQSYLPKDIANEVTSEAKKLYAIAATWLVQKHLFNNNLDLALERTKELLKLSFSSSILRKLLLILIAYFKELLRRSLKRLRSAV